MIDPYVSPEMSAVFSDDHTFKLWLAVEVAIVDAYASAGVVSVATADAVRATPAPNAANVRSRRSEANHDVVALLLAWTSEMPDEIGCSVHRGLTVSDVVDTALALQVCQASDLILAQLERLVAALRTHGLTHRTTVRIGRTHGNHAMADVWGHRVADFAFAAARAADRLRTARADVAVAKVSGATGTYACTSPAVERHAAESLGLRPVDVATQVVMRDRLAAWMCALALAVSVCEAIALEVRLGQRSEIGELTETMGPSRAVPSTMPHKDNPIAAERICGLARVVRGYVVPVMDGIALWHERDLSHSAVERVCIPSAASLTEHVISSTAGLIENLHVDSQRMATTLAGASVASASNSALVALADAGVGFSRAWSMVRSASANPPPANVAEFSDRLRVAAAHDISEDVVAELQPLEAMGQPNLAELFARLEGLAGTAGSPRT